MEENGENKKSFLKKIIDFFQVKNIVSNKYTKLKSIIAVVLVVVIFVIFASSFKVTKKEKNEKINTSLSAVEYSTNIENRLEYVLGQIKGINNVNVFVMVDASPTIKYLEETKTETNNKAENETTSIETKIVMAKNGTITSPVVVVELMPKITGVLVVAAGAKDIKMKTTLINTISAILDVSVSKVEVVEGK